MSRGDTWVVQFVNDVLLAFSWVPTWKSWCSWLDAVNIWLTLTEPLFMMKGTTWQREGERLIYSPYSINTNEFWIPSHCLPPLQCQNGHRPVSSHHLQPWSAFTLMFDSMSPFQILSPSILLFWNEEDVLFQSWFLSGIITRACKNSQNRSWKIICINMKIIKGQ